MTPRNAYLVSVKSQKPMDRTPIIAGNWKMNTDSLSANALTDAIIDKSRRGHAEIVLGVPYPFLDAIHQSIEGLSHFSLAAQNVHHEEKGAFTGEISGGMLKSVGCDYVIVGHSERRAYFGETDTLILQKIRAALSHGIRVIYCCGEQLEDRKAGNQAQVVGDQLADSICKLTSEELAQVVIAYEPVWAIGTGETASPEQAQEMHAFIRTVISEQFNQADAHAARILYGGSVKPANAKDIFSQPDVDGGLVGGASLKAESFVDIITAMEEIMA